MARRPQQDPRVTDLRRYRRERERASRAARKPPRPANEPLLGGRRNAGVFLVVAVLILAAMAYLQGRI
ncbi:MAG: hypothetical protein JWP49_666 [Phenylobacterium sp.]|jgi:hypothetical protein|nr:hypothetical protein [Phenylobacterium sp.]